MQNIYITGGAGFIGSHLIDFFLSTGYSVTCVDNLITGSIRNIEQHLDNPNFFFMKKDCADVTFGEVPCKPKHVLHLASLASPIHYTTYPLQTLRAGTIGTEQTLRIAIHFDADFLLASTSEVYGDPKIIPQSETYNGNVNPVGPRSCYDESKRCAEAFVAAYTNLGLLSGKIIRIFNTYGPRMSLNDGRAVPEFISRALKNEPLEVYGDHTRCLCYIDDTVNGIVSTMLYDLKYDELPSELLVVNIGSTGEISMLALAAKIITMCNSLSSIVFNPPKPDDPVRRVPDIRRAQTWFDWSPKTQLTEGLEKTITYFKEEIV